MISTGGGALLDSKNLKNLQRNGILVCLSARVGTLLERLKDDLTRPLLSGENPEQKIERLMKERQSILQICVPFKLTPRAKRSHRSLKKLFKRFSRSGSHK